jgi:hypothetical protein
VSAFGEATRIRLWQVFAAIGFLLWFATLLAWWWSRRAAGTLPRLPTGGAHTK